MRESGFGGFRVITKGHRGLSSPLEMRRELASGNGCCSAALSFQGGGDLPVKLCAGGGGYALVQRLTEQRVRERIPRLHRRVGILGARGNQPHLLVREVVACL